MRKVLKNKKFWLLVCLFGLLLLAGCQRNVDNEGKTLAERIIYLTTPWSDMFDESIFTAILVYPLAQVINFIGTHLHSAVLGVIITTLLYNALTLKMSIKSTVSSQKMQMVQPEITKIQAKYQGRTDEAAQRAQAQEMQQVYAKHGVNPLSSLVTPFLTFPIMIAMYYATQRAAVVCEGSLAGVPLSTTPLDAIKNIKIGWPIALVFAIMVVFQFASALLPQKLAEARRKQQKGYKAYVNEPKNNTGNYMIFSMLLLVILLALRWPSSMSLYWAVSSLSQILKTLYIQKRYIDNE